MWFTPSSASCVLFSYTEFGDAALCVASIGWWKTDFFIPSAFLIALSVTFLVRDGPGAETSLIIPTG